MEEPDIDRHPDAKHLDPDDAAAVSRLAAEWEITETRLRQLMKDHGTNLHDLANSLGKKL